MAPRHLHKAECKCRFKYGRKSREMLVKTESWIAFESLMGGVIIDCLIHYKKYEYGIKIKVQLEQRHLITWLTPSELKLKRNMDGRVYVYIDAHIFQNYLLKSLFPRFALLTESSCLNCHCPSTMIIERFDLNAHQSIWLKKNPIKTISVGYLFIYLLLDWLFYRRCDPPIISYIHLIMSESALPS